MTSDDLGGAEPAREPSKRERRLIRFAIIVGGGAIVGVLALLATAPGHLRPAQMISLGAKVLLCAYACVLVWRATRRRNR